MDDDRAGRVASAVALLRELRAEDVAGVAARVRRLLGAAAREPPPLWCMIETPPLTPAMS